MFGYDFRDAVLLELLKLSLLCTFTGMIKLLIIGISMSVKANADAIHFVK